MSVQRELVAVLTACNIQIYTQVQKESAETASYDLITQFAFQNDILDASLILLTDSALDAVYPDGAHPLCALRVILSTPQKMSVCDVAVACNGKESAIHETWMMRSDASFSRHRPCFGKSMTAVLWYNLPQGRPWTLATLATAVVPYKITWPQSNGAWSPEIHVLEETDLPALHLASVCSYDESAGVLAVGNACGEFRLYRLNANQPGESDSLRSLNPLPDCTSMDVLSPVCKL